MFGFKEEAGLKMMHLVTDLKVLKTTQKSLNPLIGDSRVFLSAIVNIFPFQCYYRYDCFVNLTNTIKNQKTVQWHFIECTESHCNKNSPVPRFKKLDLWCNCKCHIYLL